MAPSSVNDPSTSALTPGGSSPSGANVPTVLPHPLSPTIASVCPASTDHETSSTACTTPVVG